MIFKVTQIFSGKLNDNCYLFTLKARDQNTLYCTDIGTVIINLKTGYTLTSIDEMMNKYVEKEHIDNAVKHCREHAQEIEKIFIF